jgi:hypothetical protein
MSGGQDLVPGKKTKTLTALSYTFLQSLSSQYMGKQVYSPVSAPVELDRVRVPYRSCCTVLYEHKETRVPHTRATQAYIQHLYTNKEMTPDAHKDVFL